MEKVRNNGLVSVIMLSHGNGKYVEETVRSILAQTYQNWELLCVTESDNEALKSLSDLRVEDIEIIKESGKAWQFYSSGQSRIKVSYIVGQNDDTPRRNSALRGANGRWIAFLDVGDIWEPTKLERQIAFMEDHGYDFSYTKYGLIDRKSEDRGIVVGGKAHVTNQDMMKCCWPAYLTVMYDAENVGRMQLAGLKDNNDYALWLKVSEKADCYLLDECLAKHRTKWGWLGRFFLTNKIKWRYDCFRIAEGMTPIQACLYTIRNGLYGFVKWWKYVERS